MSDSVIMSITTSPPPVQAVKPAASLSTPEISFEDVLRAQTEVAQPREKIQSDRQTSPAEPPTEAAKPNQTKPKAEQKGETTTEKTESELPKDETENAEPTVKPVVIEVAATPILVQPVVVAEMQPVVETNQVPDPLVEAVQTSTSQPVAEVTLQSELAASQPIATQPTTATTVPVKTADFAQELNQAEGTETPSPQAADQVVPTSKPEPSAKSAPAKSMDTLPTSDYPESAAGKVLENTTGQTTDLKSVEAGNEQKVETGNTRQNTTQVPTNTEPATTAVKPTIESTPKNLKEALQTDGIKVQVEQDSPKQVQAPPGQTQPEAVADVGKATMTPLNNQIIEPARLAEAQTIDMIGQITRQLDKLQQSGKTTFRLQLSPQDLGQIDLKITSTQQGVGVTILAENGATSKLLETQVAQLRQSLMDAGVQISNLHVGTQGSQSNQSHTSANHPQQHRQMYSTSTQDSSVNTEAVILRNGQTLVDYKI